MKTQNTKDLPKPDHSKLLAERSEHRAVGYITNGEFSMVVEV
jgi:hypothetical protein